MVLDEAQKQNVVKQIEFYFSESNLPKDKFLKEQVASNPEGYVALNIIIAFPRVRRLFKLEDATTPDTVPETAIKDAADALKASELVAVSEDGTKIKRKQALDSEEALKAVEARSVYTRPLPYTSDLDSINAFFMKHAPVKSVRVRRHLQSKDFKGSAFVEFATEEDAQKVCSMQLEYDGAPQRLMMKRDYLERKRVARKRRAEEAKKENRELTALELEDENSDEDMGMVELVAKALGDLGSAPPEAATAPAPVAPAAASAAPAAAAPSSSAPKRKRSEDAEAEGDDAEGDEDEEGGAGEGAMEEDGAAAAAEPELAQPPPMVPGSVLRFDLEADAPAGLAPVAIRNSLGGREKGVRFVDFVPGDKHGYVRFTSPEDASKMLQEFSALEEDQQTIAEVKGFLSLVVGDEETEYYKRATDAFTNAARARGARGGPGRFGGRSGGGGGFRGGRGGRGGRFGRGGRGGRRGGGRGGRGHKRGRF